MSAGETGRGWDRKTPPPGVVLGVVSASARQLPLQSQREMGRLFLPRHLSKKPEPGRCGVGARDCAVSAKDPSGTPPTRTQQRAVGPDTRVP